MLMVSGTCGWWGRVVGGGLWLVGLVVGGGRLLLLTGGKEKVAGACAWLEVWLVRVGGCY